MSEVSDPSTGAIPPPHDGKSGGPTARDRGIGPGGETGHWQPWHFVTLFGLTAFAVWMAARHPTTPYVAWLILMVVLTTFVAVAGHGIKGMWRGALVDEFNRLSLSRLQMLAWTVLVVASLGILGVRRVLEDATTGLDIYVPPEIWLLMGISTTSLLASPLIKQSQTRTATPADADVRTERQGTELRDVRYEGKLVANRSSRQARWSNLFTGEVVGNTGYLDISKVQMFFFTVLALVTYGVAIGADLKEGRLPSQLPEFGDGMLTLLAISHGGYLAGKAAAPTSYPSPPPQTPLQTPGHSSADGPTEG